jgi:hypothetical protein
MSHFELHVRDTGRSTVESFYYGKGDQNIAQ